MGWAKREFTARERNQRSEDYCWFRAPSRWTFLPEPRPRTPEWRAYTTPAKAERKP